MEPSEPPVAAGSKPIKKRNYRISPREIRFAQLAAVGSTDSDAYREAFKPRDGVTPENIGQMAHRVAMRPRVQAEITRLRSKAEARTLLSLNERLGRLAEMARLPGQSASMVNAKVRAIAVYSDISGDRAPDRQEVSGPGGGPIAVAATIGPLVRSLTAQERLAELRAMRAMRNVTPAPAQIAAPAPAVEQPAPPAPEPVAVSA